MYLIHTYVSNIKEKQPNQPIGTLNSFLVYLMYYCCMYQNTEKLNPNEPIELIHFCVVYPLLDGVIILISFYMINKVKLSAQRLVSNQKFEEYNQEAEFALADILYLP